MKQGKKYINKKGQEYFMSPVDYFRITQGSGVGTHKGTRAIDLGSKNGDRDAYFAPATVKCIWTYAPSGEAIWQSVYDVVCPNGYIGKVTFVTVHDNSFDAYVGQVVPQGNQLGNMGDKGNASGIHLHIEMAQSDNTNFIKNEYGIWTLEANETDYDSVCFFDDTEIVDYPGLEPKYINDTEPSDPDKVGTPVERNTKVNQIEVLADNAYARKTPCGDKLGYINKGIYNSLEQSYADGYTWHRVEDSMWIAQGDWTVYYPGTKPTPVIKEKQAIDISHHNIYPNVDDNVIIIKATEGVGYTDDCFESHFKNAQEQGKTIGIYHVCRFDNPENTAELEAEWFLKVAKKDCFYILDVEPNYNDATRVNKWLHIVEEKTGVKPILYINESMENSYGYDTNYPLWIAKYSSNKPNLKYFKDYIMWQYTDCREIDGRYYDSSYINGNLEDYIVKDYNEVEFSYTAEKDGWYKVYLYKGETIKIKR